MHARSVWNVTDNRARIHIHHHHVCRARNVETVSFRVNRQDVPTAFAAELNLLDNMVAGLREGLRAESNNEKRKQNGNVEAAPAKNLDRGLLSRKRGRSLNHSSLSGYQPPDGFKALPVTVALVSVVVSVFAS